MPDPKLDSQWMNDLLARVGVEIRAVPGTYMAPTFHAMFTAILDRQDALDARLRALELKGQTE